MSNLDEYIAGTDPRNAGDVFQVDAPVVMPDGGLKLRFRVIPQRIYEVQAADSLSGAWATIHTLPPQPDAGTGEVNLPPSGNTVRFFRARVIPRK